MMTGMRCKPGSCLNNLHVSKPSISGITRSSRIRSGSSVPAFSRPSLPDFAEMYLISGKEEVNMARRTTRLSELSSIASILII
jgi:hypothetical protein